MRTTRRIVAISCLVASGLLAACNLPWTDAGRNTGATMVVETVFALQTIMVATQTASAGLLQTPSGTPVPSPTATFAPTPTFTSPTVKTTALCWNGPGNAYPVVSGVQAGTVVELLGISSKVGWFIIKNPVYGDRCWIEADRLDVDPFFNTAGLTVFNPPPTPSPRETAIPTETP